MASLKVFAFALIIGIISCHQGLVTIGGPARHRTFGDEGVVNSIILIVILTTS